LRRRRLSVSRRCRCAVGPVQIFSVGQAQLVGHLFRFGTDAISCSLLQRTHDDGVSLATDRAGPDTALFRQRLPRSTITLQSSELALCVGVHKAPYGNEGGTNSPSRLPRFLMMARYRKADLSVHFKAAAGSEKPEGRRPQGIGHGENYTAMVEAAGIRRRGRRTAQREMPLEEIRFQRFGVVVRGRVRRELGGFFNCLKSIEGFTCGARENSWRIRIRLMVGFFELNWPTVDMVTGARDARNQQSEVMEAQKGRGWV